jgi:hypothetical protein
MQEYIILQASCQWLFAAKISLSSDYNIGYTSTDKSSWGVLLVGPECVQESSDRLGEVDELRQAARGVRPHGTAALTGSPGVPGRMAIGEALAPS